MRIVRYGFVNGLQTNFVRQIRRPLAIIPKYAKPFPPAFDLGISEVYNDVYRSGRKKNLSNVRIHASSLSLDRALLPKSQNIGYKLLEYASGFKGLFVFAVAALLANFLLQFLVSFFRGNDDKEGVSVSSFVPDIFSLSTKLFRTSDSAIPVQEIEKPLDLTTWNVCRLLQRKSLGPDHTKYTFELPASKSSVIKLALGQEVFLPI